MIHLFGMAEKDVILVRNGNGDSSTDATGLLIKRQLLPGESMGRPLLGKNSVGRPNPPIMPDGKRWSPFLTYSIKQQAQWAEIFLRDITLGEAIEDDLRASKEAATQALNNGNRKAYKLLQRYANQTLREALEANDLEELRARFLPRSISGLQLFEPINAKIIFRRT